MDKISTPKTLYLSGHMMAHPSLPVLVYKKAIASQGAIKDKIFHQHFSKHGWTGIWENGIYDYHHFHSNAHEALGIARGSVKLMLGGKDGETLTASAGDLIVLPAGTGHKCLEKSDSLLVVGAYPKGQENYDMRRNAEHISSEKLEAVSLPSSDPFYGSDGPLIQLWKAS